VQVCCCCYLYSFAATCALCCAIFSCS
jgi:hypothetical protein